jgi:hypothetical protein
MPANLPPSDVRDFVYAFDLLLHQLPEMRGEHRLIRELREIITHFKRYATDALRPVSMKGVDQFVGVLEGIIDKFNNVQQKIRAVSTPEQEIVLEDTLRTGGQFLLFMKTGYKKKYGMEINSPRRRSSRRRSRSSRRSRNSRRSRV